MNKGKKVLVAPLDWGMGHGTRCVPVIRSLIQKGAEVIVAGTGRPAAFLKEEFPELEHLHLPGYEVSYPHHGSMSLRMLRRSPVILSAIRREHRVLDMMINDHNLGAVISDNRFGLWSEKIPSVYMTHQVSIKAPVGWSFTEGLLYMVHRKYIKHFDECWVPDIAEGGGFSGELAHKRRSPVPTYYIGPLSRFELPPAKPEKKYDIMAMISGPEPQRSILEEKLMDQLMDSGLKAIVVLGKPETDEHETHDKLEIHSHLNSEKLMEAMLASDLIICRSGYSSIMDLAALGKKAVLIPTPGQTEQEYLAWYHQFKQHFYSISQGDLQLEDILQESEKYKGIRLVKNTSILEERINNLLESL
jgi:uncharacterized protein (TIGR00661 family)